MDRGRRARTAALIGVSVITLGAAMACGKRDANARAFNGGMAQPDTYPVMLNKDMPFRYPPALYAEKIQGNVTLRLYIDADGAVASDSTRVMESSGSPTLDSAAIKGSRELRFVPAKLRGNPMPVSILFPVYFRHPEAAPPPGDSILKQSAVASDSGGKRDTAKSSGSDGKRSSKSSSSRKRRHRSD